MRRVDSMMAHLTKIPCLFSVSEIEYKREIEEAVVVGHVKMDCLIIKQKPPHI